MTLTINGIDKTKNILWKSLRIENILTNQVDTCKFRIRQKIRDGSLYNPINGGIVVVANGATTIFGGIIVKVEQITDEYSTIFYDIQCIDYTRLLDAKLVTSDYENMSVNDIIADINTNYLTGFTINNVSCPTILSFISFKYQNVSECLKQLADLTQYNWWVDYDKDIHFVDSGVEVAPVDIKDTTGVYERDSLVIRRDNTQLKNVIYVRGGEYLGDTITATYIADGSQNVFPLTYKYDNDDFKVTVTGQEKNVGQEPTDVPESYDVLWNNESRLIRFALAAKIPNNGSDIKVIGRRFLPVISKVRDTDAINDTASVEGGSGEHEFLIVDNSIVTKEGARNRARAELLAYSSSLVEGEFKSQTDGFKAGQRVRVNSSHLDIDQYFVINKVITKMWTPNEPMYEVSLISTRTFGIIEFLRSLINKDKLNIEVGLNEITDTTESVNNALGLVETITTSTEHNLQQESIDLTETTTVQSPDYEVEFVYHEFVPSGKKRGGNFDGAVFQ